MKTIIPHNWQAFAEARPEGRILLALTSPTYREPWEPPSLADARNRFYAFSSSPRQPGYGADVHGWLATHPGGHVLLPIVQAVQPAYVAHVSPPSEDAAYLDRGIPQEQIDAERARAATATTGDIPRYLVNLLRALIDKDGVALPAPNLKGKGMVWSARLIQRLTGQPVAATAATLAADPRMAVRAREDAAARAAHEARRAEAKAQEAWRGEGVDIDGVAYTGLAARDALAARARLVVKTSAPAAARLVFYMDQGAVRMESLPSRMAAGFDAAPSAAHVVRGTKQVYTTAHAVEGFEGDVGEVGRFTLATRAINSGGKPVENVQAGTPAVLIHPSAYLSPRAEAIASRDGHLPHAWAYGRFVLLDPKSAQAPFDPFAAERHKARAADEEEVDPEVAALFTHRPPPTWTTVRKLGSSPTFDGVRKHVAKFYGGENKEVREVSPGLWSLHQTSGARIESTAIRSPKPGHFCFEQGTWSDA